MPATEHRFPPLDEDLRRAIVEQTARTVRETYIFEREADEMSELLLSRYQDGSFDQVAEIPRLTSALTETLHAVRKDLHLAALAWAPPAEAIPATGDDIESLRRRWRRSNHEFRKVEILLGNIGYVDLRGFTTASSGGPTATAAMQFLADTDALIFDLRENTGGRDLLYFLMSYLFDEPVHVHTQIYRDHEEQAWTYGHVPGRRLADRPAFVLISNATFSAGEDFSYNLQQQGRVTVIGERTKGGAHPVEFYRFPELFLELVVPHAYSRNPISGGNWEDTGVLPDIEVPASEALLVAHEKALEALLEEASDEDEKRFRTWALESVRLRRTPFMPDPQGLDAYTGDYTNGVRIERVSDRLTFAWDGHTYSLTPLSEHCFEFDHGIQRATFHVEGGEAGAFLWETEDGDAWRIPRVRETEGPAT
jgi:hypothetical protein